MPGAEFGEGPGPTARKGPPECRGDLLPEVVQAPVRDGKQGQDVGVERDQGAQGLPRAGHRPGVERRHRPGRRPDQLRNLPGNRGIGLAPLRPRLQCRDERGVPCLKEPQGRPVRHRWVQCRRRRLHQGRPTPRILDQLFCLAGTEQASGLTGLAERFR